MSIDTFFTLLILRIVIGLVGTYIGLLQASRRKGDQRWELRRCWLLIISFVFLAIPVAVYILAIFSLPSNYGA